MYSQDGRDQVARALRDGGWLAFERPLPTVTAQVMRRWPGTLLDVGANTGFYSLAMAVASSAVRSIAYEPVPAVAELLRRNVELNSLGERVELVEAAIARESGPRRLHLPPPQQDGTIETSASLDPRFKSSIESVVDVRALSLEDAWRQAGTPEVTVVKVDVEGCEPDVLSGAGELVERCRPVFAIEVLGGSDVAAIEDLRADWNYVDVSLSTVEAVVNRKPLLADPLAPNHLLVPWERLGLVVQDLEGMEKRFEVTLLS
jgi:FkbM family methyltransferase